MLFRPEAVDAHLHNAVGRKKPCGDYRQQGADQSWCEGNSFDRAWIRCSGLLNHGWLVRRMTPGLRVRFKPLLNLRFTQEAALGCDLPGVMLSYGVVALLMAVRSWMAWAAAAPQLCENFCSLRRFCSEETPLKSVLNVSFRHADGCISSPFGELLVWAPVVPFRVTPQWRTGLIDTESRSGQG